MSTLRFLNGSYNRASGTRDAFGRLSDRLVDEGYPEMRVTSGDREKADQIEVFVARYRQQASGSGPYGDVRYWDGSADGYPGGTRWVRHSPAGTVAVPGTSDHERRRSNDLAMPYNSDTAAHHRARQLAPEYGIECDGINFREWWHWTFRGPLGQIGGSTASTDSRPFEEDDMYDAAAEKRLMEKLDQVARVAAPLKMYTYGSGVVAVNPATGGWSILGPGYPEVLNHLGLAAGGYPRIDEGQFGYATQYLPNTVGIPSLDDADGFSEQDLAAIKDAIEQNRVALTQAQLDQLTAAVAAGAREGGEAGARAAVEGLTFVVKPG